jgi:hypothetical protein
VRETFKTHAGAGVGWTAVAPPPPPRAKSPSPAYLMQTTPTLSPFSMKMTPL